MHGLQEHVKQIETFTAVKKRGWCDVSERFVYQWIRFIISKYDWSMSNLNATKLRGEMDRMSPEGDLASTNLYVFIPTSVRQLSVISMAVQYP